MSKKINIPEGDALGRLITQALKNEAKCVCTLYIRDKMWADISQKIATTSKQFSSKTE